MKDFAIKKSRPRKGRESRVTTQIYRSVAVTALISTPAEALIPCCCIGQTRGTSLFGPTGSKSIFSMLYRTAFTLRSSLGQLPMPTLPVIAFLKLLIG